ncbi:hypothetical protein LTR22_011219 [Elasticomyces elasticus]|nr:hypothetical protein LTR22_011219 [Elasticomyces elasticus]KAK4919150.1 hypothetical protein LTR49_013154 [Elasticomyces elasticus]KAK5753196.1 hypothetical protein LTS12_016767 [Elasticomyces elasticus]
MKTRSSSAKPAGTRSAGESAAKVKKPRAKKTSAAKTRNRNVFPLMELPAELRKQIYRTVFAEDGIIEVTKVTNKAHDNTMPSLSFCSCKKSKCLLCRMGHIVTWNLPMAKSMTIKKRKGRLQNVDGAAILRLDKATHNEAAAVLYGDIRFRFLNPQAFELFCFKTGEHSARLRNVEIKKWSVYTSRHYFRVVDPDSKFLRFKIPDPPKDPDVLYSWMFLNILPLFTQPGTNGCRCQYVSGGECFCQTAAQRRVFDAIDLSGWDNYAPWVTVFPAIADRSGKAIMQAAWDDWASSPATRKVIAKLSK